MRQNIQDPIFFLIYCNIDRLWAKWQPQHLSDGYVPNIGVPIGHNVNEQWIHGEVQQCQIAFLIILV